MKNELGSCVAYMFDMAKEGRPEFRYARSDLPKPLRQHSEGTALNIRIGGF